MFRLILFCALLMSAAACSKAVPPLAANYYQIKAVDELGLTGAESPKDVGDLLKAKFGKKEPVEGNYSESVKVIEGEANAVIVFTIDGKPDDSVKSEQHVVEVDLPAAGTASVTGYGVRFKCWRGERPDSWQAGLCP